MHHAARTMADTAASDLALDCVIEDARWKAVSDVTEICDRVAAACLPAINHDATMAATVMLSNDRHLHELNARFRDQDKPTNVLSFPNDDEEPDPDTGALYLGDIAISYETVLREADESGKTLANHLTHMIVHGVLHLAGYDHLDDAEAEEMEGMEVDILQGLGIADPYTQI
jgi:probable rRNA maturation factor